MSSELRLVVAHLHPLRAAMTASAVIRLPRLTILSICCGIEVARRIREEAGDEPGNKREMILFYNIDRPVPVHAVGFRYRQRHAS